MDTVVGGLFNSVAEYLYGIGVISGDSSASAEAVDNADVIEHILRDDVVCTQTFNADREFLMIVP